jgi:NTE family protein
MLKKTGILVLLLTITLGTIFAERPRVGLVLGGGGAKGFAHIAVLELLEEMGIPVDLVIGVSSGAIVGGLYSVGYSPEMMKDSLLDLDWTSLFLDTPVSPFENELDTGDLLIRYNQGDLKKGVSPGQTAYILFKTLTAKIPSYIDFDTLPIPFRAGVVKIPEGRVELIRRGDLAEAIRASISLPGLFDPFDIDGNLYIDGGTLDNLPIRLAREMGCDIIIASELFPDSESISTSPLEVPGLMLGLYFNTISRDQYSLADAVLKADVQNYSIMDFQKSQEIYSLARGEKERMRAELEKIKELLSVWPEKSPSLSGSYRELPSLEPASLSITGVLPGDRNYIQKYFSLLIQGKPLEPARFADFIQRVYETGNYRFAAARIDTRQGKTELELLLYPKNYKGTTFLFGGNYHGTLSGNSISKLSIQGGVQIEGLSGPGSVLSLDASWIDVLSFGVLYLQPLSPKIFAAAQTEIMLDKDITVSGFFPQEPKENRLFLISGELRGGILIDRQSIFKAGALFFTADPQEPPAGKDGRNTALGFGAAFIYNSLDYLFIPSGGIYAGVENRLYFPLPFNEPLFFDILSLDLQGVLPLNREFSVVAAAFAGSDLLDLAGLGLKRSSLEELPAGFTAFDRQYFPHICGTDRYYSHKAAASLALQFQPWKNLSVLGGQLILSLSASAGELFNELDHFTFDSLIWNASLNIGLRLRNNFGFLLRVGAGSAGSDRPRIFLAFDIGQAVRSGIKPGH